MTVKENAEAILSVNDGLEILRLTVKDNAASIVALVDQMKKVTTKLGRVPTHEDLKLIVDKIGVVEEVQANILDSLEKMVNTRNFDREELVQFKRDCGQDILQGKRKIAGLEREVFKDRSRY